MDVHENARSCARSRKLLVERVMKQGWSLSAAAEASGMSVRRSREWLQRAGAGESLLDRSSRPRSSPRALTAKRAAMIKLRRERFTMRRIAELTGVSVATVSRVCARYGLSRLKNLDPPPPIIRYEHVRPGDLLHLDIKKLGRFERAGHRVTGNRRISSRHAGWEAMHVAIDDHSRVTYAEILPDETATTTSAFLQRAVSWFADRGAPIKTLLTDNGSAYVSYEFAAACRALNIRHKRTRPYTPRTNGKAERVIQTLLREWAYRFTFNSSAERRNLLSPYLHFYNSHRAHSALSYNPPLSRLTRNNVLKLHN
ncbi:MAG TPA: IS481 family transposase [Pyrinomonadaceae bacterium]